MVAPIPPKGAAVPAEEVAALKVTGAVLPKEKVALFAGAAVVAGAGAAVPKPPKAPLAAVWLLRVCPKANVTWGAGAVAAGAAVLLAAAGCLPN